MTTPTRHVLIVGGGLAGPCLALSLARRNIRSTIFEIRSRPSTMGGSISLGPNALQVLDRYAGVYDRITAEGYTYRRFGVYFDDGEKFGEIAVGEEGKDEAGYPSVMIMRAVLNKLLLDAAEESGMIDVKFGMTFSSIQEDEEGVTVYFDDGVSARGDLSALTACTQRFASTSLGLPLPHHLSMAYVSFPAMMFTPSGVLMAIPAEHEATTLAWVINKNMEERDRQGWKEFEQSGEATRAAKADYSDIDSQPVRSLLDNADDAKARLWAAYSIPPLTNWHTSRVCLIGDAAHGLPPHGGQGSAMAFEDGAILTRLLEAQGSRPYSELFERLESLRMPRVEKYRERSGSVGGTLKHGTGPWTWDLKKLAMRGFFWWNNGVLDHAKEYAYNVDKVDLGL